MVTCFICQKAFSANSGGQLTSHVQESHGISHEDYVIRAEYGGKAPQCACGLCDERPVFKRGKFLEYAKFHQRFEARERRWIEKFGQPKCERCESTVAFVRGKPSKFCSSSCANMGNGFSNPLIQQKIAQKVAAKYGVKNISQVPDVRLRISSSMRGKSHCHTESSKRLISQASIARWKNGEYRESTASAIRLSINSNLTEIERRKLAMKANHEIPSFVEKMWKGNRNRLSRLHVHVRSALNLDSYGFISEQRVGKFWADELNPKYKIIIEIYGDHPHANPSKYSADSLIRLRGQSYLAKEKWESDQLRRETLEQDGYRVIVIWGSDNIDDSKTKIKRLLEDSHLGKSPNS
jgi:very-short-patch-repair endonuclease